MIVKSWKRLWEEGEGEGGEGESARRRVGRQNEVHDSLGVQDVEYMLKVLGERVERTMFLEQVLVTAGSSAEEEEKKRACTTQKWIQTAANLVTSCV